MPRASIVIPTYNRAELLRETLKSVLDQTWRDFEVIVIDDGSTDETRSIVKQCEGQVRYLYQLNRGRSAARNLGIQESRGAYVMFLDSDDLILPRALEVLVRYLDLHPDADAVSSEAIYFDSSGRAGGKVIAGGTESPSARNNLLEALALQNVIGAIHSTLIRREWLNRVDQPCFDEALDFTEDADLWFRLAAVGCSFHHVPEVTCKYRMHGGNTNAPGYLSNPRYRDSYRRARLKVWESQVFPRLSALTHFRFLYLLLLDPTYGDDTLYDRVLASPRFAELSNEVQSQVLYLVGVEEFLKGRATNVARARLARAVKLNPRSLKICTTYFLALISSQAMLRFVSSSRSIRRDLVR